MSPRSLDYKAFLELHKILPAQSTSPLPNPLPSQLPSQPAAPIRRPSNGTDSTVDTSTRMRPRAATPRFKPFTPPRSLLLHARSDGLAPIRPAAGRTDPTRRMKHVNLSDPASAPVRWHADLKQRVGKCIMFGCDASQISKAAGVTRALGGEWRTLMAGAEGFLTGNGEGEYWAKGRRGLEAREVVWGEMDSFVSLDLLYNSSLDCAGAVLLCLERDTDKGLGTLESDFAREDCPTSLDGILADLSHSNMSTTQTIYGMPSRLG